MYHHTQSCLAVKLRIVPNDQFVYNIQTTIIKSTIINKSSILINKELIIKDIHKCNNLGNEKYPIC